MNRRSLLELFMLPGSLLALPAPILRAQATFGKTIVAKAVVEILHPDGKTTVFTLTYAPENNQSFELLANGVVQIEGRGYTLTGKTLTLTFTDPPAATDDLWCRYRAEFSV